MSTSRNNDFYCPFCGHTKKDLEYCEECKSPFKDKLGKVAFSEGFSKVKNSHPSRKQDYQNGLDRITYMESLPPIKERVILACLNRLKDGPIPTEIHQEIANTYGEMIKPEVTGMYIGEQSIKQQISWSLFMGPELQYTMGKVIKMREELNKG